MASKEGDSVIPITGESGSSLNIGFSDSIWANWINSGEEGPGAIAHGVLGRVAVRLQVALSSSGLDFWWRSARVGSLDAALWRLCNPGLLAGLTDGCSLLGIGSWLKRLVAFGETADSPVGTGGRGISGGGVGGERTREAWRTGADGRDHASSKRHSATVLFAQLRGLSLLAADRILPSLNGP
jgi:hypothetical protein